MTRVGDGFVIAENLSVAWVETTKMVHAHNGHKAFHTVTRIAEPLVEDPTIRAGCDALLAARKMQAVNTVANTIFPSAMAGVATSPADLVGRYSASYPKIRRFAPNNKGTYFGRIVAHPSPSGPRDQLVPLINSLRSEAAASRPMSARYEVRVGDLADVDADSINDEDQPAPAVDDEDGVAIDVPIFAPHKDTGRRGFPCLSMLSFQLDNTRVHLFAQYRYEYLVAKGYGNYLGLARMLQYVAREGGLETGEMTIAAGRIQSDAPARDLVNYLGQAWTDG